MSYKIIYREKYGSDGKDVVYVTYPEDDSLVCLKGNVSESLHKSFLDRVKVFFREVFLPQGYPESVSEDYWDYQLWDSIQAFCSTLSGTLTTQAILKSVGVGDSNTTSLSAAITWILKDGTGMIGRIIFAWKEGTNLDADCKKWRLFADFLNDSAMCIEMFILPSTPVFLTGVLCVSTTMKAIVGVAGGATKASVTQHQAIRNNLGDVSAKDGSQETCLNLIGSIFGICLLSFIADSNVLAKFVFLVCTLLHLYSNYRAVKALNFRTLNKERFLILLKTYLKYQIVENSVTVNDKESVVLGSGITDESFCGFHIEMGCSLKKLIDKKLISHEELNFYLQRSESLSDSYVVIVCMPLKTIFVPFKQNFTEKDVLLAYFHSVLLGIATCVTNDINLEIFSEVHKSGTPLDLIMERVRKNSVSDIKNKTKEFNLNTTLAENFMKNHSIPFEEILILDEFVKIEFESFLSAIKNSGWIVDRHHVLIGDWRGLWGPDVHLKNA